MPVPPAIDLPQGTLHLLILRAIALEPMHGWAISQRIQQVTQDVVQIPQGSLYPEWRRMTLQTTDHYVTAAEGDIPQDLNRTIQRPCVRVQPDIFFLGE